MSGEPGISSSAGRGRDRATALISGFVRAAIAAQEERTVQGIFRAALSRLGQLGLSVFFAEVRAGGEEFHFFESDGFFREIAGQIAEKKGRVVQLSAAPIQQAILAQPDGVLIENLRPLIAQALEQPLSKVKLPRSLSAVGAAIPVSGKIEFTVTASGPELDSSVAPAFGLFARQLGTAIEISRRLEQLTRSNHELSLMLELGRAVSSSLDQREILAKGVQVAARVLGCSAAYIFVPDAEQTSLGCAASEDPLSTIEPGVRLPLDRPSMSALAFRTGQPQMSADPTHDPRVDGALIAKFGCRSTLAVPLRSRETTLGVLVLIERAADRPFDEQHERLAVHAAQLLAASVENAALYAEQRRRAEEMSLFNEAARSLAGTLDLGPLLSQAGETLRKLLDASTCIIWLLDPRSRSLTIHAAPLDFPELAGKRISMDEPSAVLQAIQARAPVQIPDARSSPLVRQELVLLLGSQTLLAVPLIARGEMVGVVVLGDSRRGRVFSPAEVERASAMAGQIAMAIFTVELIGDLRRSYSELTRTQAELIDRERLAALGELSASIAHEVRNPLGIIFNALGSLRRMLKPSAGNVGLLLGIIGEEADRLNQMVGDLLDYSRPYKPTLQPLQLEPLVADAIGAAHAQSGRAALPDGGSDEGVRMEVRIPRDLTLRADPRLLRQALINLLVNALQAMPKGGTLEVVAERVATAAGGAEAWLRIRDTGPGIPESLRARVFHPFFTTKATGTGLGLAVVKRIVDGHGGRISLRAGDEVGAEFEVWLPMEA